MNKNHKIILEWLGGYLITLLVIYLLIAFIQNNLDWLSVFINQEDLNKQAGHRVVIILTCFFSFIGFIMAKNFECELKDAFDRFK